MVSLSLFSSYSLISTLLLFFQHFLAVRSQEYLLPLSHQCLYEKGNFTVNSNFAPNLNRLVSSSLPSLPLNPSGYYNVSVGENTGRVNSVSLCRGDVKPEECLSCIVAAGKEIRRRCPDQTQAIIWYEHCMLRYTNETISNALVTSPTFSLSNRQNFTGDVVGIESALRDLLENLRDRAAAGGMQKKFAVNSAKAPSFQTLYGMVQCMPYLSQSDCSDCLRQSFGNIPVCCDKKKGGRWHTPSCFFRFENYRFHNSSVVQQPTSSPLSG